MLMKKPVTTLLPAIRYIYEFKKKGRTWYKDHGIHMLERFGYTPSEALDFFSFVVDKPHELEIIVAGRSPSAACKWAVGRKERLCKEAEEIVLKKAKDVGLIEYCSHFGIVLGDLTKITMKAAFDDKAWREKRYIKKLEEARRNLKHFLVQLMNVGELNRDQTVGEVLEKLG